jgi:hypothetical protein
MPQRTVSFLRAFLLSSFAAAVLAVPAARAADPAAACQKATARAVTQCAAKTASAEEGCFAKTGAACPAGDKKLVKAQDGLAKQIEKGCADASAVAAAGYAPLDPAGLVARLGAACTREAADIAARAYGGAEGTLLGSAAADDRKCLLTAGKEAGRILAKGLGAVSKCVGKSCDARRLDQVDAQLAKLAASAAKKLGKQCPNLEALVGLDVDAFIAEAGGRKVDATASPCDPMDADYCIYPFPNDYFSVGDATSRTGRRLAFQSEALPANSQGVRVDPAKWNVVDGFSVGPTFLLFDDQLDLAQSGAPPITDLAASIDPSSPALVLDAETGDRQLFWLERDQQGPTPGERAIIGHVGANLENGRRYLVAMRSLKDGAGAPLAAEEVFAAYRDRTGTGQLPAEARRSHMETIFGELAGHGVARSELYLAWDFTTQSSEATSEKLLHMRDDAFAALGGAAPQFTVDTVDEPLNANTFRRIDGTFQVPLYLTELGIPGSELNLGPDGLPEHDGEFTASYRCIIPYAATTGGAAPAVPARPALYGHGLLGSANETSAGHVQAFANEHDFVVCGTDWTGFAEEDLVFVAFTVLRDFSKFPRFIERQHQGVLNFMVLGKLLLAEDGFASHPAFQVGGESVIDPSGLFYDGNSQGGILGGVLAAFATDITRFVLGVPGINYSTLLDRSTDFEQFRTLLSGYYVNGVDRTTLIALAQILWDQTDPSGHVRHTLSDPYPGTPAKKILYQVAFGDHQVAPVSVEIAARSNGAAIHTPVLAPGKVVPEVAPYYGIPAIPAYPFDGSAVVIWDSGNPAPPIGNVAPPVIVDGDPEWADLSPCAQDHDSDPHECPRRQPAARVQKSEFLKNDGAVVDVCGGAACLAPLP